ncbi:MAG: aspartate kinase [Candidatus Obscuribacterales bacterium]|nr:aspartate kinase [Candidatus Obscuribacterales bacterium]
MARLVQKFGGSSLRDAKHIQRVARIVADAYREGKELVVVVSAMGDTTDQLIELAGQVSQHPDPRELDVLLGTGEQISIAMLSLALQSLGLKARSFTGPQAGILTDDTNGFAKIKTVHPSRIETSLRRGEIAVVAGFQGMTRSSELTTLGRGGSDTTAVALTAALGADRCDIYTDVDGIYTTDPRTVGTARKLRAISYEEMLALASAGAQVLNARSVELAMKNKVPVRLRSTFESTDTGTLVTSSELAPEYQVCGVACDSDRISISFILGQNFSVDASFANELHSAKTLNLIERLEHVGVNASAIFKTNDELQNVCQIDFTCEKRIARDVQNLLSNALADFPASQFKVDAGIAKISVIGNAVHTDIHLQNDLLSTLTNAEIPVSMLSADRLSISAIVPEQHKDTAIRKVHARFCQETRSPDLVAASI